MSDSGMDSMEVGSDNEGDLAGSGQVTPAASRGPVEAETNSCDAVESSFPDFETLLVENGLSDNWFEPVPTRTSIS
jgi:hypothetical protein